MTEPMRLLASPRGKWISLVLLISLVAVSGCWIYGRVASHASPQTESTHWLPVRLQKIEQKLGLTGRIQAARQEVLSAPFDGVIRAVLVQEGQTVQEGQPLLRLDTALIDIQLRQAEVDLLRAQRAVHQLRNWDEGSEVSRARRAVQTTSATLEATQSNLRDTRALFARGIVARMEVDALVQQVHAQQRDLLAAQEELRAVQARGMGEERAIAEMEFANARARQEALSEQRQQGEIRAPFAGVVVRPSAPEGSKSVKAQPGVSVSFGTPLLTIVSHHRLQALTRVEETDLHQLHEGMPAQITGDGFAGRVLTGQIANIAVQGSAVDTPGAPAHYDVVVAVDAPSVEAAAQVRLGMSARLEILLYRNEKSSVVPPQALHTDDNGNAYVIYRADFDSVPSKQWVKLGRSVLQGIEIKGISEGYVLVESER